MSSSSVSSRQHLSPPPTAELLAANPLSPNVRAPPGNPPNVGAPPGNPPLPQRRPSSRFLPSSRRRPQRRPTPRLPATPLLPACLPATPLLPACLPASPLSPTPASTNPLLRATTLSSPVFEIMGKATRMGEAGSGQSSKIANQIIVAANLLGVSEALVFAEEAGLEKRTFLEALRGGAAASSAMEIFGERMIDRDFTTGGFVEYMVKDLGMGLGRGEVQEEGERVVLPGAALCQQLCLAMVASGDGKMGIQGLVTAIERINRKKD